ncbi:hypothetical protein [Streptomyces sp. NPDC090994]
MSEPDRNRRERVDLPLPDGPPGDLSGDLSGDLVERLKRTDESFRR